MYLSLIKLNPRSRRAMTEASRPYELHRSLLTAFPDEAAGGPGRVLFRLDIDRETSDMSVLVQSDNQPDWSKLNGSGGFVTMHDYKKFDPPLSKGQVLRFRLRANPTRRVKETGKRQGILREEEQIEWLRKKGAPCGLELIEASVFDEGFTRDKKTNQNGFKHNMTLLSVRFDGLLRVMNPEAFRDTLEDGIGSAKGLGFGLLSIAPYRGEV